MIHIEAAARSHPGCVRENNEDNFFLNGVYMQPEECNHGGLYYVQPVQKRQIYAVCDGMGGTHGGERASYLSVSHMSELQIQRIKTFPADIQDYINKITTAIKQSGDEFTQSGCTLAAVYMDGVHARIAHIGDSRVYVKQARRPLVQATADHTQAAWLAERGMIRPEDAAVHPAKNMLRRYIGAPDTEGRTPDISKRLRVRRGDIFLLCSDGLSNLMSLQEMDAALETGESCKQICRNLTTLALSRGGYDNVTVITIKIT